MWSASSSTVTSTPVEVAVALLDQVLEPAGAGHDDVDARRRRWTCGLLADAAEDRCGVVRPAACGERRQRRVDLVDELAGRREDEGARAAPVRRTAGRGEAGHQREQERVRLAGAGAAAAEDVAARERVGQGGGLDGSGGRDAARGEHGDEVGGHAEVGEAEGPEEDKGVLSMVVSHQRMWICRGPAAEEWRGLARGKTERAAVASVTERPAPPRILAG